MAPAKRLVDHLPRPGDAYEGAFAGENGRPVPRPADPDFTPVPWPAPPAPEAFHGLAGETARLIEPQTEADPLAILVQLLVSFGSAAGRHAYFPVESDRHYTNLFTVLVGRTAKGRKGTSMGRVESLLRGAADDDFLDKRVQGGLSSGEGLIWAVHDEIRKKEPIKKKGVVVDYQEVITDAGVSDKRLLALEPEFASVLRVAARDGCTLSTVIRQAWDCGRLRTLTKNSPARATDAHISIVGHITQQELTKCLSETEAANGFANRFLWVCVRRSKLLPAGGKHLDLGLLRTKLARALEHARLVDFLIRDREASALWEATYPELSRERPGMLGLVTNRAEAQVTRLSCLYALLDLSNVVMAEHLTAALALWDYCVRSCEYLFGAGTGSNLADEILDLLRANPEGLTLTQISGFFQRNKSATQIKTALTVLLNGGLVLEGKKAAGGKPAEKWRAVPTNATNATNPDESKGLG